MARGNYLPARSPSNRGLISDPCCVAPQLFAEGGSFTAPYLALGFRILIPFRFPSPAAAAAAALCLLAPLARAAPLPAWDLTAKPVPAAPSHNPNATGLLPPGWRDDSAWADVKVTYTPGTFEGTRFISVHVRDLKRGAAQLATLFPTDLPQETIRLVVTARASRPISLSVQVRDAGQPYRSWWSDQARVGSAFAPQTFEFQTGKIPRPALFLIGIPAPATVDIAEIRFETVASAPAPSQTETENGNLLRHSRFPLGLQPPMHAARDFCDRDQFSIEPDPAETSGPSGAPALRIRSAAEFFWNGELIPIRARDRIHTASVWVKGDGVFRLSAYETDRQINEKYLRVRPEAGWQRVDLRFQPMRAGQNHFLRYTSNGSLWIDGAMVRAGEEAIPYASGTEAEVALALPEGEAAIAGIQFEPEPARLRYAVTGNLPKHARLEARVVLATGEAADLPTIPLAEGTGLKEGLLEFAAFPGRELGAFRIEARAVAADATPLSRWSERVVHRVLTPRHWGTFAPDSPFGTHVRPTRRHILMAKATGNNWVRLHNDGNHITAWALLEPSKGDWRWADRDLDRYRDGRMEVLGMLETAPKWASLWGDTEKGPSATGGPGYFEMYFQPKSVSDYVAYVKAVTTRYRGRIRAYEVWNEPWQVKWFGAAYTEEEGRQKIITSAQPQKDYTALMKAARDAAKAVDPELLIVGFNSTSNPTSRPVPEGVMSGSEWTAGVLASGGQRHADAASFHHYSAEPNGFPDDDGARATREAFGPNPRIPLRVKLPIWMSEGSSTVGGRIRHGLYKHSLPYTNGEDPIALAESVLRYDLALLAAGVSKIFLYSMGDQAPGSPGSFRAQVCSDGSLHPSALGRATLAWHIEGLRFTRALEPAGGVHAFLFESATRSVAVLCPRPEHALLPLPALPEVVARDLFGNVIPADTPLGDTTRFLSVEGPPGRLDRLLHQSPKP